MKGQSEFGAICQTGKAGIRIAQFIIGEHMGETYTKRSRVKSKKCRVIQKRVRG